MSDKVGEDGRVMIRAYLYVINNWSSCDSEYDDDRAPECYPGIVMSNVLLSEKELEDKVERWTRVVSKIREEYDEEHRRTKREVEEAAKKSLQALDPYALGHLARTKGMSSVEDRMRTLQELADKVGEITQLERYTFFYNMDLAIRDVVNRILGHGHVQPRELASLARDYGVENCLVEIRQRWQDAARSFEDLRLVVPTAEIYMSHSLHHLPIEGEETMLWEDEDE